MLLNGEDLIYQLSLLDVPHIGHVHAKILCDHFAVARDIFSASQNALGKIEGIGEVRARSIRQYRNFRKAEKEIQFIRRYGIEPLFIKDAGYPKRLLNCYDPPVLLFYKGNVDLNAGRIVSIVGTRRNSEYGRLAVEKMIREFSAYDILVVSGLAFGIDAIAHNCCLKNGLTPLGLLAMDLT